LIKMDNWGIGERSICTALFNTNTYTSHLRLQSLGILLWSPICVDGAKQLYSTVLENKNNWVQDI
jgi:hypothetical protein